MSIQILSNLNYPIGNIINQELQNAQSTRIAIAFLKYSGIKVIEKSLNQCLDNNGSVEIIAGLDFKTTDPQSMHYLIQLQKSKPNLKFYCYGDKDVNKNSIVFHPKIYLFQGKRETTGIVGSTNLTAGGLMTNFEANVIFKESKPLYFSQLEAIYNSVKFTDSIFSPDEEYLAGYSDVYKAFLQNEESAMKDKNVQEVVRQIRKREEFLPGTVPSLKSLIIDVIKNKQQLRAEFVPLQEIYVELEKIVEEKKLNYKMDTFRNSIRGELNTHEDNSNHPSNMHLFVRAKDEKGYYSLTNNGQNYQGR
ncbi:restriction endonuclease [Patescibacteria group bacterium]|nr:restriction endonuclease [Patescibacteria group bacterium]MBU1934093.1 restriction endonuclease [Patescibacteria group bacterium]MBU2008134.1 restriction endonuclease [Patescibacteria group bacterium]MBU2233823.1 restriction endonuclease [Patescibacteria group bacterium]MBU2263738.1 restriction endonuclease [Patescibacteria group bacterium]